MVTPALNTIVKMLEHLPESTQNDVVEHLRIYLAEIEDKQKWDQSYVRTQPKLAEAARHARQQIAEGKAEPLDVEYARLVS